MSPRSMALAFRIWQVCEPVGWNLTIGQIAEELEEPLARVRWVIAKKGWGNRVRVQSAGFFDASVQAVVPFSEICEITESFK